MNIKTIPETCAMCKSYSPFETIEAVGNCMNEANNITNTIGENVPVVIDKKQMICPHYAKSIAQSVRELGF